MSLLLLHLGYIIWPSFLEAFAAVLGMDATDISMDDHIFLLCLIRGSGGMFTNQA
jgi:hypothetical protein